MPAFSLPWLAGILAVFGGFVCQTMAAGGASSVSILTFSGKIEISRQEGTWDPAYTNQILHVGNRLRTAANSRATIRLSDGTTMTIGADASLRVPEGRKRVTLNPIKGLFYFFHRDTPGEFELWGNSVVAAVRGTEFHLEAHEDGVWVMSVLEGEVRLQSVDGYLDLKTGQAALAIPGMEPQPAVMRQETDLIQWALYYPAVLDADELILGPSEQAMLGMSLSAYRAGDLSLALARCPWEKPAKSAMEAVYRAALLLSVGNVEEAENLLALVPAGEGDTRKGRIGEVEPELVAGSLKLAVQELIAVVKARPRVRAKTIKPQTASEWLAESYRLQSESNLEEALHAARESVRLSPTFGLAWERAAELQFSIGRVSPAREAVNQSLRLSPRSGRAKALEGFLLAAANRMTEALRSFEEAIALDGEQANAWLGRGLCRIRRGELEAGREDLLIAASLEPQRSVLRSYLGKAYVQSRDPERAHKEFELAQRLDRHDPTAWLYSALFLLEEGRSNEAVAALERSSALNDNRSLFRSRLLLDQDRAVRGANLARIYQDAGMNEVAVREATKAVESDYGNYSAHWFLANSYNALRDPRQVSLRYETAWLSEYLLANLLAPAGAGTLSPLVSQQEYSSLFEQNRLGFISDTEYSSRGDWVQAAVQHGRYNNSAYVAEVYYRTENGERPNNDLEQLTLSLRLKQQLTVNDSVYLQAIYYDAESGDLAPYYDPASANPTLRVTEQQEPLLLTGYHHQWAPGVHTLALAGRLQDAVDLTNGLGETIFFGARQGIREYASYARYNQVYRGEQEIYVSELQQLWQAREHTVVLGGRYQAGRFEVRSDLRNGATFPNNIPIGRNPITQDLDADFERFGLYGYEQWRPFKSLLLLGGVSYDWVKHPTNYRFAPLTEGEQSRDLVGPKAGLVWTPASGTVIRAGYSKALGGVSFEQSFRLEPSQVAGLNQAFRSVIPEAVAGATAAPSFETAGVRWEQQFPKHTYVSASLSLLRSDAERTVGAVQFDPRSNIPTPDPYQPTSTCESLNYEERTFSITINQLVRDELAFGAAYQLTRANLESRYLDLPTGILVKSPFTSSRDEEATLHQFRLYATLNHPGGIFCGGEALWFLQDNDEDASGKADDEFWQFNVYVGYRFLRRRAELRLALLNVTDQDYRLNPLNLAAYLPRERTMTVGLRFSF